MSNQLDRALEAIDAGLLEHPGQGAPSEADALRELRWVAEDVGYTRESCEIIRAHVTTVRASLWAVAEFAQAPVSDENSSVCLNARYHTLGLIGLEALFADLEDRIGRVVGVAA